MGPARIKQRRVEGGDEKKSYVDLNMVLLNFLFLLRALTIVPEIPESRNAPDTLKRTGCPAFIATNAARESPESHLLLWKMWVMGSWLLRTLRHIGKQAPELAHSEINRARQGVTSGKNSEEPEMYGA
ncbi:hypothetical protein AAE478_008807 [Parahypoxylon ruwenzoriense]